MKRHGIFYFLVCCYLTSVLGVGAGESRMDVESNQRFEHEIVPLLEKGMEDHFKMLLWNQMGEQYAYWGESELAQKYYRKADEVLDSLLKEKGDPAHDMVEPFWGYLSPRFIVTGYFERDYDRIVGKITRIKDPKKKKKEYSKLLDDMLHHKGEDLVMRIYEQHREALGEVPDMEVRIAVKTGDFDKMRSMLKKEACCRLEFFIREYSDAASIEQNKQLLTWLEGAKPESDDLKKRWNWLSVKVFLYHRVGEAKKADAVLTEMEGLVFTPSGEGDYEQVEQLATLYRAYRDIGRQEQADQVFAWLLDFLENNQKEIEESGHLVPVLAMARIRSSGELERMEQLMEIVSPDVFTWSIAVQLFADEAMRSNRKDMALRWIEKLEERSQSDEYIQQRILGEILEKELIELWILTGEYSRTVPTWKRIQAPYQEFKDRILIDLSVALWIHQQYTDESIYQGILQSLKDRLSH